MFPVAFDPMLLLAIAAFGFGLSLATYRWFAAHNAWPMGEWQAHRPGLPIAIGLFAVLFAMLFAVARGGVTLLAVPFFGFITGLLWTRLTRVGAQSSLLLAPATVLGLLGYWIVAVSSLDPAGSGIPPVERSGAPLILEPISPSQARFGPSQKPAHVQPVQVQQVPPPAWLDRERQPAIPVERDRLPPAQVDRNRVSPSQSTYEYDRPKQQQR